MSSQSPIYCIHQEFLPAGDQVQAIKQLTEQLNAGVKKHVLLGVTGSGKTYTMANVIAQTNKPALILAPNKTLAAQLYAEFKTFFPQSAVEYFVSYYDYYQPEAYVAAKDLFIEKDAAINEHIEQLRLSATKSLLERRDCIIVATVSAIYGIGKPSEYQSMMLLLKQKEKISQKNIIAQLVKMQYARNDLAFERGCFRVRGDQIDIFPAEHADKAIRIELFDDEIEHIKVFDPLTGRVEHGLLTFALYPRSHYVTPRETILEAIENIKLELRDRLEEFYKENRLVEAQRLEQRTRYDLELLYEVGFCKGIENYSRYLSGVKPGDAPPTLLDYLAEDALIFLDESHVMIGQLNAMYNGDKSRKQNLVDYGFRLPSAMDNRPLKFIEFEQKQQAMVYVSATPGEYELTHGMHVVEQIVRPTGLVDPIVEVRPALTQVDDLLSEINKRVPNERVLVTTLTKKMSEQLTQYLSEQGILVKYLHSDIDAVERVEILHDLRLGKFHVLVGINLLREGLDLPEVSLVAILDADKQGFLRSTRSLIQTIGRAARNLQGKAILYGDVITPAMQQALDETNRRREVQTAYNLAHNITPKGVFKSVKSMLEISYETEDQQAQAKLKLNAKECQKRIKVLEKEMRQLASNLEFEQAALKRDELNQLKQALLEMDM